MRNFFYASAGLFLLMLTAAIAFHMGSTMAVANASHDRVGIVGVYDLAEFLLDEQGQVWSFNPPNVCWQLAGPSVTDGLFPTGVNRADAKFWSWKWFITTNNEVWYRDHSSDPWTNCGPWPGGTVPTQEQSWGAIKGQFEKDD